MIANDKPIKGADGYWYNPDGQRILPNVVAPPPEASYAASRNAFGKQMIYNKKTGEIVTQPQDVRTKAQDIMNEGLSNPIDISSATGIYGMIMNAANIFTDAIGLGFHDPNNAKATRTMNSLAFQTWKAFAEDFAGRPTSVYILKEIEKNIPRPNSLFTDSARAKEQFENLRNMIAEAINKNNNLLNLRTLTPNHRSLIRVKQEDLKSLYSQYETFLLLKPQATPSGGMSSELESIMNEFQR